MVVRMVRCQRVHIFEPRQSVGVLCDGTCTDSCRNCVRHSLCCYCNTGMHALLRVISTCSYALLILKCLASHPGRQYVQSMVTDTQENVVDLLFVCVLIIDCLVLLPGWFLNSDVQTIVSCLRIIL